MPAMKAKQANWPGFVVEAAVEALKAATGEYQQAVVGNRIAKPVEYQDARGFILQADRMIESVAPDLQKKDPAALGQVRAGLVELKKVFPVADAAADAGQGLWRRARAKCRKHRACRRQADVKAVPAQVTMRLLAAAFVAGGAVGVGAALLMRPPPVLAAPAAHAADDLAALKAAFRRPAKVPFPANNPYSEQKRALGEALFHDKRLSIDGSLACASCHERGKGFADGKVEGRGVPGRALKRHTPTLWNLAWSSPVFWDGRARSLEEQVAGPIESPDEMAQPLGPLIARLAADPATARAFAEAFPEAPRVDAANLAKAIATYERTLRVAANAFRPLDRRRRAGVDRATRLPASGCLPARRSA